jgi:hypothetical protein
LKTTIIDMTTNKYYRLWCLSAYVLLAGTLAAQGVYSGSGTIPNNTVAELTENFTLGAVENSNDENGTYLLLNKSAKRINLVSQGLVRIGDVNLQGFKPAWMQVNAQSGTIHAYAKADYLFQADSFFYSLHRGGFQLPNLHTMPALMEGDAGMVFYDSTARQLTLWDGQQYQKLLMAPESAKKYTIMTAPGPFGNTQQGVFYLQPAQENFVWVIPPSSLLDERVLEIKNAGMYSVSLSPTLGDTIEGNNQDITLLPGQYIRLHATTIGWMRLGE